MQNVDKISCFFATKRVHEDRKIGFMGVLKGPFVLRGFETNSEVAKSKARCGIRS